MVFLARFAGLGAGEDGVFVRVLESCGPGLALIVGYLVRPEEVVAHEVEDTGNE